MLDFYEFFAGAGMARAGLGSSWRCLFANDFDNKKGRIYRANWGDAELKVCDVGALTPDDLPRGANLAWASFPCQDLSLAGGGGGLKGDRSGTFWPFWHLMKALIDQSRAPRLIVLENVCGTLTSHGGKDFATICAAVHQEGYRFGAIVIDAALFLPQSRQRLFVIALRADANLPGDITEVEPTQHCHPATLRRAFDQLSPRLKRDWIWWRIPLPPKHNISFADLIEGCPPDVPWRSREETRQLLDMMSDVNRAKVKEAQRQGRLMVGCIYKRTRHDEFGRKVQRAEVRFDDKAGCLRTPAGGSSRQVILVVNGASVKSRLISARKTARLMGLSDNYHLPENYNEAYHLTGDGVVVPVVRHLAKHLFEPILALEATRTEVAA